MAKKISRNKVPNKKQTKKLGKQNEKVDKIRKPSKLELSFIHYADINNIVLEREFKFHPIRKWRFDFADLKNKIAIEIEGGVWNAGRHTRGYGFRNDTIKYNQATVLGWRVLRYCTVDDMVTYFLEDYKSICG